ncbi:MAG: B12-binding domain-containing radical SAM protein [Desulfobacteraceae bacterium 4572_89]|nr:MAG: B12-binding domain-containing radical SAM protein [Desulfobacteraceae bacterium 4572_89]
MKILFVNPACLDKRVFNDDDKVIPIGLYYMAALLLENKFDVRILNLASPAGIDEMQGQKTQPRQNSNDSVHDSAQDPILAFTAVIEKEKPNFIGFSVTNPTRINALACARAARKILPHAWIVFGGPAPGFMGDYLLKTCPEIDIIVRGEGESTCLALVKSIKKGESFKGRNVKGIKGILFHENNKIIDTGPAEPIQDLDSLVHPSKYFVFQHLSMSRGCPGKCTFCNSPKFWGASGIRFHSAQWLAMEIQALAKKGITHFYISDDTFTMDRNRVIEFCSLIISAGITITWNAISRVDYIDKELLSNMRKAGCIQISFGVESGAEKIKKTLGKPMSNKKCIQAFSLTLSHGIMPRAYFIYGSPGETWDTIQESVDLLIKLRPLGAIFYMLVIFPGTHLYKYALEKRLVTHEIWDQDIEDLPWFDLDDNLDFPQVKAFGKKLRQTFYTNLNQFADSIDLKEDKSLYPFHADFLSRLAMTFSHGEYSNDPRIKNPDKIAEKLFNRSLTYLPQPRAFLGIAMLLQKRKNFDQAVTLFEKGLGHFPGNKDLSMGMGICLMNQGRFKKALTFFTPFRNESGMGHYINICNSQDTRHESRL